MKFCEAPRISAWATLYTATKFVLMQSRRRVDAFGVPLHMTFAFKAFHDLLPPPLPCPALSKLLYRVAHLLANVGWVDFVLGCSTTLLGPAVGIFSSAVAATTHRVLTRSRVRTPMSKGNQIHSSTLWSLRFPKMYMATLGYKGNVLHYKYRVVQSFKSETFPL